MLDYRNTMYGGRTTFPDANLLRFGKKRSGRARARDPNSRTRRTRGGGGRHARRYIAPNPIGLFELRPEASALVPIAIQVRATGRGV
jgi:hypothetical protein